MPRVAELGLNDGPTSASAWRRFGIAVRDLWLTLRRGRPEAHYLARTRKRMADGNLRETLGLEVHDEAATRAKSGRWLAQLMALGLRPDHLCVEYGCGSLWCAEPFIRYLQSRRYVGLDVTDFFYAAGRDRLGSLLDEKQVHLAVISRRSLKAIAALKPDFVFAHRVLHHVPLRGLARFMRNICSLLDERTVLVIENLPRPQRNSAVKAPRYGLAEIQVLLPRNWICQAHPSGFIIRHRNWTQASSRRIA